MRVLALPLYPNEFSSRIRVEFFVPYLAAEGIEVDSCPPLSRVAFEDCYRGERRERIRYHLAELVGRARSLLRAGSYDLVWVQKGYALFPWRGFEALRKLFSGRMVYDLDDDVLNLAPIEVPRWARAVADTDQVRGIHHAADLVLCGNRTLLADAERMGKQARYLPSTIPLRHYPLEAVGEERAPTLAWVGTASNIHYLEPLAQVLNRLADSFPGLRLLLITDSVAGLSLEPFGNCRVEVEVWDREREAEQIRRGWVGIMPLPDDPWTRRKSGYKILQYYACRLPVVASPIGGNRDLVIEGKTGYLAATLADWETALRRLLSDRGHRAELGMKGRGELETTLSTEAWARPLAAWFRELGPRERPA